ncbi:trihelix transcription factor ENAP1-like [Andrographis paniculata]|uniref:trihelix transcription factor ENAP1-like n=1 Tax=Andrographis paniculata TaxID=175694 RepID=UPI0021E856D9|nr:trihelix transcription factor ENAP1-like [Andrographis paniculata]
MTPPPTPSPPPPDAASPKQPMPDDDGKPAPSSSPLPGVSSDLPTPAAKTPAFPAREDFWSEDATRTLIDAWGGHYLELNRGNLRQKHWQEVADAVNAASVKLRRTDVQCKNRIDTIKKKYKIEKSRTLQSNGRYVSTWPHFPSLDFLIGDSFSKSHTPGPNRNPRRKPPNSPEITPPPPPPSATIYSLPRPQSATNHPRENDPKLGQQLKLPWQVPVGPRSKRSVAERNFSVMAAAAAAMEDAYEEDEWCRRRPAAAAGRKRKGSKMLAEAIMRLGKVYEKVEGEKQQQILELEKQKMQFTMELEIQRMEIFMESQVQLHKLKNNSCL